jgi:metal-responsive CopG/Arc/MetJ family transcriptional regulator
MAETARVTVSLDSELLSEADRLARRQGIPRSAFVAKALRHLVRGERQELEVRRYVEALREMPETATEVKLADRLAEEALRAVPWDED